ncbi:MAG: PHP domain-containing protein [Fibrobacteres bacterium]|nr:PHP domain-containing protein [Fibrobacterota bacterium]
MSDGYRKKYIDLHLHSTYSDGTLSVKEIVEYASTKKLAAISLTDHDCIAGIHETMDVAEKIGLEVIPGVEISSMYEDTDVHVLGYFFDPDNQDMKRKMDEIRLIRLERAKRIVDRLNAKNILLRFDRVLEFAKGFSIGRPHIAAAIMAEEYATTYSEAFDKYLGNGTEFYIPIKKLSPKEAIALIKAAGGIAVLAHPYVFEDQTIVERLLKEGFDGIEIFYPKQPSTTVRNFRQLCQKYNLLESGGSDCHGEYYGDVNIGSAHVPYSVLDRMRAFLHK